MTDPARIVVIGATGYTGRLVAEALTRGPSTTAPAPVLLAARDPHRLAALAAGTRAESAVLDVEDEAAVRRLLRHGDAVINCAGPFELLGETVVRACIDVGAHYVDTTGEQPWMRRVHDRYDTAARAAGVAVVNSMAFEFALGDCAAAIAARELGPRLRSLDVTYAWRGAASSRGTRRTSLRIAGTRAWQLEDGRWRRRPIAARLRTVRLGTGRVRPAVLFGAGEVVTVPRWTELRAARGWLVMGRGAYLLRLVSPALPLLVRLLRPIAEPLITRRPDPTPEARRASRFTIRVELRDANGAARVIEVAGRDPYGLTAAIAIRGALRALEADAPHGVLAPSQLLDPTALLDALAPHLTWKSEV